MDVTGFFAFFKDNQMTNKQNHNTSITPNEEIRIAEGSHVELHFEVSLDNGTVIDSTFHRPEPVSLTIGDESLLEGFEKVLMNLRAGDTRTARLDAEQAFGEWNPENVQTFSKAQFALIGEGNNDGANNTDESQANEPVIGMIIEFEDKGKNTLPGVISEISENDVKVDFNHPLAGQAVNFKVQIFRVTPAGQTGIKIA